MEKPRTALVLFTGFLGSGKTTVLNDLLASLAGKRAAVVVNEWGKRGVDGSLLADPSGFGVTELPGGQIFCACVAPAFLAALERLSALDLDYILVETSGLAKPATVSVLAAEAVRRSSGRLEYRGLICVADASRFALLAAAAAATAEQASYADRFVVTKADLADGAAVAAVLEALEALNPGTPAALRRGLPLGAREILGDLETAPPRSAALAPEDKWKGWPGGRPKSVTLVPAGPVARSALEAFLAAAGAASFRIKGFLRLADGSADGEAVLADCVEETAAIAPAADRADAADPALTIILKNPPLSAEALLELWREKTDTQAALEA